MREVDRLQMERESKVISYINRLPRGHGGIDFAAVAAELGIGVMACKITYSRLIDRKAISLPSSKGVELKTRIYKSHKHKHFGSIKNKSGTRYKKG